MRIAQDKPSPRLRSHSAGAHRRDSVAPAMEPFGMQGAAMEKLHPPADLLALQRIVAGRPSPRSIGTLAPQHATVQAKRAPWPERTDDAESARIHEAARAGTSGAGGPLPHLEQIQKAFGHHDVRGVESHADGKAKKASRDIGAEAFTVDNHVAFVRAPTLHTAAHEVAHVVQQRAGVQLKDGVGQEGDRYEQHANQVADLVVQGRSAEGLLDREVNENRPMPPRPATQALHVQRLIEMRDVGRGEQSGFARLPELIDRLNDMSAALTYALDANNMLTYTVIPNRTPGHFDQAMIDFIDKGPLLPLRLTNRHGLVGNPADGFHSRVRVDAYRTGYVDMDDLLASTDLALQLMLVHFLTERAVTPNYAERLGKSPLTEFELGHASGIEAEARLLRDFFGDPSIRVDANWPDEKIARVFVNDRGDRIRVRITRGRGDTVNVDAGSVEVQTADGVIHTAYEYKAILDAAAGRPIW